MRKKNHVAEAEGGRQALEMIQRGNPDIVISDAVMPVLAPAEGFMWGAVISSTMWMLIVWAGFILVF